jgi:hypothetical protein
MPSSVRMASGARRPSVRSVGRTLRIGRLAGIPIGIQPLWLAVVALITYARGHDYYGVVDADCPLGIVSVTDLERRMRAAAVS